MVARQMPSVLQQSMALFILLKSSQCVPCSGIHRFKILENETTGIGSVLCIGLKYQNQYQDRKIQIVASLACRKIFSQIWTLERNESCAPHWVQLSLNTAANHLTIQNIEFKMHSKKNFKFVCLSVWFYTVLVHASVFFSSKPLWHAYLCTSAHVLVCSMCECNERMLACFSSRHFQSISWG